MGNGENGENGAESIRGAGEARELMYMGKGSGSVKKQVEDTLSGDTFHLKDLATKSRIGIKA